MSSESYEIGKEVWENITQIKKAFFEVCVERDRLKQAVEELTEEFHAAINEPEYAGTRQDWKNRCYLAELELAALKESYINLQEHMMAEKRCDFIEHNKND